MKFVNLCRGWHGGVIAARPSLMWEGCPALLGLRAKAEE